MESSCQKFGLNLLQVLSSKDFDKNIIYSPLSIYMALGMTVCGAQNTTLTQMMKILHGDDKNTTNFHKQLCNCIETTNIDCKENGAVKVANKLFLDNKYVLLDSYVKLMKEFYHGAIEKMDFQGNPSKSVKDINNWVEQQTNGKIKDLLQDNNINNMTRLILVNAIYFKGSWQKEFSLVGEKDFHLLNGKTRKTKMITKTLNFKYLKNANLGFSAVQIPFKMMGNHEYSFMIVLPNEKTGLSTLEKEIYKNEWKSILGDDLFQYSSVHITMPKFRVECSFSLKSVLQTLGMTNPFSDEADFSLMTGNRDLMIDDVIHKAFIDIDEHGVEAAAATAVMMMMCCAMMEPQDPIEFICNHPFMFALVKQGSLPLFVGHFTNC